MTFTKVMDRNKKAPEKSGSLFPCTTSKSESTTRVVDRRRLELVAQCELHRARVRQQARILAKVAGVRNREVQRLNVESRKVQHVEHFPSELERVSFGPRHLPTLGKSRIQAGEAVATDRVARANLTRESGLKRTECSSRCGCAAEDVDASIGILGRANRRHRSDLLCIAGDLPVRRILGSVANADWETTRPARQPGELPSADQSFPNAVSIGGEPAAPAKRQFPDPVRVDLMRRIEIRNTARCFRIPGIDDLTGKSAFRSDAVGVGRNVHRLREGVVEVELQPMRHAVAEADLQTVVRGV